jgi:hydroxyacylglutathione hydrolase
VILETFAVGRLQANCYVVGDEDTREVLVIDPGDEGPALVEELAARGLRVVAVIASHSHLDHTGAVHDVLERLPEARFYMHRLDYPAIAVQAPSAPMWYGHDVTPPREPDRYVEHGEVLRAGRHEFTVLHCPGHTPGSICIYAPPEDGSAGSVFTGDVLFQGSIGRFDFPGSDGRALIRSIRDHLLSLPDDTAVHPGHGPSTGIAAERRHNPFLVNPRATLGFEVD